MYSPHNPKVISITLWKLGEEYTVLGLTTNPAKTEYIAMRKKGEKLQFINIEIEGTEYNHYI